MRILVTGANGFIGSALCRHLMQANYAVRAMVRRQAEAPLLATEHQLINQIDGATDWYSHLRGVDVVIHLAARAHVLKEESANPLMEFRRTNTEGTINLAQQAQQNSVRRFIYLSSIGVNGNHTLDKSFDENDVPNPQEDYALSKWEAEQALNEMSRDSKMEVVILRPPLVYGPQCKGNFLRLLRLAQLSIPLPLASVINLRSLIYIENLLDVLLLCINHANASGKTYLVSDNETISTPQLLFLLGNALGHQVKLFPLPLPVLLALGKITGKYNEIAKLTYSLTVNSTKIRDELNWQPRFTLQQGLQATASWYKSNAK